MSIIHQLHKPEANNHDGDVVFVHGLDGDYRTTWHPKDQADCFWPEWLGADNSSLAIWSVEYEVSSLKWNGHAISLTERAKSVLAAMDARGLGAKPIVFICHSLGGLIVKQMLRHAVDMQVPRWKAILKYTRGIVFLSTPNSGSNIANWIKHLNYVLRPTVAIEDLLRGNRSSIATVGHNT